MSSGDLQEWLVTDGLGGFAMGTVGGVRTRRYHSLWTHALGSPTERFLILNGLEVGIVTADGRRARLMPQNYSFDYFLNQYILAGRIEQVVYINNRNIYISCKAFNVIFNFP